MALSAGRESYNDFLGFEGSPTRRLAHTAPRFVVLVDFVDIGVWEPTKAICRFPDRVLLEPFGLPD